MTVWIDRLFDPPFFCYLAAIAAALKLRIAKKWGTILPVNVTSFKSVVDCDDDVLGLFATISEDNGDNSLSDEIDVDGDAWILICNEFNPELERKLCESYKQKSH